MIEKLKSNTGNTEAAVEVLNLVKKLKEERTELSIAEIGIGWGATAVELIKLLSSKDEYHFFDFEDAVKELHEDLIKINKNQVKLRAYGNSRKYLDSYSWNLAKMLMEGGVKKFDLVYLDGAHTFIYDGITVCLLKELIEKGGYLVLDDLNWSLAKSPTCNPDVKPEIVDYYTQEQIDTCQIEMVKEIFLDTDKRYEEIEKGYSKRRAIFRRIE